MKARLEETKDSRQKAEHVVEYPSFIIQNSTLELFLPIK